MKPIKCLISIALILMILLEVLPLNAIASTSREAQSINDTIELLTPKNFRDTSTSTEIDEEQYPTTTIDAGRAGTITINEYTLKASICRQSIGISGRILPVSLYETWDFHSGGAYEDVWRFNYQSYVDFDETDAYWYTEDNKEVYFNISEDNENTYISEDEEYTLVVNVDDESSLITANNGNIYSFNGDGYLIRLTDSGNHFMSFSYNNDYKLTRVTDGVGRYYQISYDVHGNPIELGAYNADGSKVQITTLDGGIIDVKETYSYTYYANNKIMSKTITFQDGNTVLYYYDGNGRLVYYENIDGSYVELYSNSLKVSSVYKRSSNNTLVESIRYTRASGTANLITKTDNISGDISKYYYLRNGNVLYSFEDGIYTYYQYDQNNNLLYTYSDDEELDNIILNSNFSSSDFWTLINANISDGKLNTIGQTIDGTVEAGVGYQRIEVNALEGDEYSFSTEYIRDVINANNNAAIFDCEYDEDNNIYTVGNNVLNYVPVISGQIQTLKLSRDTKYFYVFLFSNPTGSFENVKLFKREPNVQDEIDEDDSEANDNTNTSRVGTTTNTHGNTITTTIYNGTQLENEMVTLENYCSNGNYLSYSIDEAGNETCYEYNSSNGLLEEIENPLGEITYYGYNAMGALSQIKRTIETANGSTQDITQTYSYSGDKLSSITHNGIVYNYEYDAYGNISSININEEEYVDYSYDRKNLNSLTFANGFVEYYTYNTNNQITSISYNTPSNVKYSYTYDAKGVLTGITDTTLGTTINYTDSNTTIVDSNNCTLFSKSVDEDEQIKNLFGLSYTVKEETEEIEDDAQTNPGGSITNITEEGSLLGLDLKANTKTTKDYFSRTLQHYSTVGVEDVLEEDNYWNYEGTTDNDQRLYMETDYIYANRQSGSNRTTTNLVQRMISSIGKEHTGRGKSYSSYYAYDELNRLTGISYNRYGQYVGGYHYEYNELDEIILEVDRFNSKVYNYSYDNGGNIVSRNTYSIEDYSNGELLDNAIPISTDTMLYENNDWNDELTSYNNHTISYDAIGNPNKSYSKTLGGDITEGTLTWCGRKLEKYTTDNNEYRYFYDDHGLRTKKEAYNITTTNDEQAMILSEVTEYIWEQEHLEGYRITTYNDNDTIVVIVKVFYDANDTPNGVVFYNGDSAKQFWFVRDAQGNVIEMVDYVNDTTIDLIYDSFGNMTYELNSSELDTAKENIASYTGIQKFFAELAYGLMYSLYLAVLIQINVYTYRNYIYDIESGMYYNQSRYYNPTYGRFINADSPDYVDTNTGTVFSSNMFAYCENDPVNSVDYNGNIKISNKIKRTTLSTALDILLDIFAPEFSGPLDVITKSLKVIFKGSKNASKIAKIINNLKHGTVPRVTGLFSRFFTKIRTAIYRACGYLISYSIVYSVTGIGKCLIRMIVNSSFKKQVDIIFCLLSAGGWIGLFLDILDQDFDNICYLW